VTGFIPINAGAPTTTLSQEISLTFSTNTQAFPATPPPPDVVAALQVARSALAAAQSALVPPSATVQLNEM
tara:strand:+ start:215 stop:427 length:213 start_codon:yes stop_codon:yes gene_type:complete